MPESESGALTSLATPQLIYTLCLTVIDISYTHKTRKSNPFIKKVTFFHD